MQRSTRRKLHQLVDELPESTLEVLETLIEEWSFPSQDRLFQAIEQFRATLELPGSRAVQTPDLDVDWNQTMKRVKLRGEERFLAEQKRMQALGILDEAGRPTSRRLPEDMKRGSKSSLAT